MDEGWKKALDHLKNAFNNFERRWNQQQFKMESLIGSLVCNASLDQRTKQNNRPFSKGVHAILELEQLRDLEKE